MSEDHFVTDVKRAVSVNDGALAQAIADAYIAEYYDASDVPEHRKISPDDDPTTEVEIHNELAMELEAAVEERARDMYRRHNE